MRVSVSVSLVLGCVVAYAGAHAATVGLQDYQRAEVMQSPRAARLIMNAAVVPHWLPDGNRFWYRRQTARGWEFIAVDPERAARSPAFDHTELAAALSAALGTAVDATHLPLDEYHFSAADGRQISISADEADISCDVLAALCRRHARKPPGADAILSPDGRSEVFARDDNLWLRNPATGEERALTTTGERYFTYGKLPDTSLARVLQQTSDLSIPPVGVDWSPDSRRLVVIRADERGLPDYNFLQSVRADGDRRPKLVTLRTPLSGEGKDRAPVEVSIIDVGSGAIRLVKAPEEGFVEPLLWDAKGQRFLGAVLGWHSRNATLSEVTMDTGEARSVFRETTGTTLQLGPLEENDAPAIVALWKTNEAIWFSQKDGWGHLYRIDLATGRAKNAITRGNWTIQNIIDVDEAAQRVYFTAVGREAGQDPYFRHLYSVRLDGKDLRLLTPEAADHDFRGRRDPDLGEPDIPAPAISPSHRYFIDTYSTIERAPVSVLRRIDGRVVMSLERADVSATVNAGWLTPEPFAVKAADGKTDIYGVMIKPAHFDASRKYPVIEHIYNGPQAVVTPHNYVAARGGSHFVADAQSFAQLGFVVVLMDGRGTPLRSKAFQDYLFNNLASFAIEDHVSAIRQLAATHPYMDLERVGVFGHSFGGYASARAILDYPDFYKVAVSSAGPYDPYGMYPLDMLFADPVFKGGSAVPTGPGDRPTNWGAIDLTQKVSRLKGKWMIAYADLDENAYPAVTVKLVNALVVANKEFDLLLMPNGSHHFVRDPYFVRRRWDYFVRYLMGAEPPKDYAFKAAGSESAD